MTVEQSTIFKRELNESTIRGIGFADINAHLLDNLLVGKNIKHNSFRYFITNFLWVCSKLLKSQIKKKSASILLVPAEINKERSYGLFKPLYKFLPTHHFHQVPLDEMFNSISASIFLRWVLLFPFVAFRAVKIVTGKKNYQLLSELKWILITDTIFHYLWILQMQHFFKESSFRSVLVDWDRHKLQSLVLIAAKLNGIQTFTFVHGAIYTPQKFVPLIANRCFIWGNSHAEFFTGLGETSNKLIKVGNTRFSKTLPERAPVLDKYKLPAGKKIILHPSQNFAEDHEIVKELHSFISKNDHFLLAVKTHPSQNFQELQNNIKDLKDIIILDPAMSVKEALSITEFVIIVSSTFSIDAMMSGIPVAIYKTHNPIRGISINLVQKAKVEVLKTAKDFEDVLGAVQCIPATRYFNMEHQQEFVHDYCEYFGDESGKMISAVLSA